MQTSSSKAAAQANETARLKQENSRLRARLAVLEKEVERHRNLRKLADRHSSNSTGKTAEDYVCRLLGVKSTERNADHDFVIGRRRFEIKGSKCCLGYSGADRKHSFVRWTWHNFLGSSHQKTFHRLLLVGEADETRRDTYLDKKSPYVIFDVPIEFAREIAASRKNYGGRFTFQLFTHRAGAKTSQLCQRMWEYEVTRAELKKRYPRHSA